MTLKDTLYNLLINGVQFEQMGLKSSLFLLLFSTVIGIYVFVVYRMFVRKVLYNINMNISLVGIVIITAAIMLTIQTNLVLSLGMVGALSIVRYRTAVKDPMDLFFLFWAISAGIMCGANQIVLTFAETILLTMVVFILGQLPTTKAPYVMVINGTYSGLEESLNEVLEKYSRYHKIKARSIVGENVRMVIEIKVKDEQGLLDEITKLETVGKVSLLTYEGDVVC